MLFLLSATIASPSPSPCVCTGDAPLLEPTVTCRAVGDPHYLNFHHQKYDFFGRGLYEHARFTVASCGCEVAVQVFLVKLISGWPANSAIAATALRAGTTDFAITEGGVVTIARPGFANEILMPTSKASTLVVGATTLKREPHGRGWAWRILLPGGVGSFLICKLLTTIL